MEKFVYHNIIEEYKGYLDENIEETVYFESKLILQTDDDPTYLRNNIREENFKLNNVLNRNHSIVYCSDLRSFRKIRDYQDYTLEILDKLGEDSLLEARINSIQAINTIGNLNKKHFFHEIRKSKKEMPITVELTTKNFEFKFENEPFENLIELIDTISEKKYENLFFNYNKYYFGYENINETIKQNLKTPSANSLAFLYIILFVFSRNEEETYKLSMISDLTNRLISKTEKYLPKEIDKKYHLIDEINSKMSEIKTSKSSHQKFFEAKAVAKLRSSNR